MKSVIELAKNNARILQNNSQLLEKLGQVEHDLFVTVAVLDQIQKYCDSIQKLQGVLVSINQTPEQPQFVEQIRHNNPQTDP